MSFNTRNILKDFPIFRIFRFKIKLEWASNINKVNVKNKHMIGFYWIKKISCNVYSGADACLIYKY